MRPLTDDFDRVEKALIDLREVKPEQARALLSRKPIVLRLGKSVAVSRAGHAALFTLANLVPRVFKRPLILDAPATVLDAKPLVPWPASRLGEAAQSLGVEFEDGSTLDSTLLLLGDATGDGMRLSVAGWSACVAPGDWGDDLAGPDDNPLGGIAAAALAMSEVFSKLLKLSPESTCRPVSISLWRPDLPAEDADAVGPALRFLLGELWVLGLGHLGQGLLWALSMLPYPKPGEVELVLQDYDRAISANLGPQALMTRDSVGNRKTQICSDFLRLRGFNPAIVDRRFDENTKRHAMEPVVAACCFDGQGPRWLLDGAFEQALVAGVGGAVSDFDEIQVHGLPLPSGRASEIWKPMEPNGTAERLAGDNAYYRAIREQHRCGDLELAGVSVAVPFVGAMTSALIVAEILRTLTGGPQYSFQQIQLRHPVDRRARMRNTAENLSPKYTQRYQVAAA